MNNWIASAAWLLVVACLPSPGVAQNFLGAGFSDVTLNAFTSVSTQRAPTRTASDTGSAPLGMPNDVDVLLRANGIPFPNLPNSVGSAFASSAGDNTGRFGVGVNGFFFTAGIPPEALLASGTFSQTITNNAASTVPLFVGVTIPAPTLQFFGVGDSLPRGVDPRRDVTGVVTASLATRLIHPDGSILRNTPLAYGMTVFRDPISGVLRALTIDGQVVPRFEEPDGSFGFRLAAFDDDDLLLGELGPGDVLEFTLDYLASASTGFGETGIFAAIGDPFDPSGDGSRFDIHAGSAVDPGAGVPEPPVATMLALGVCLLTIARMRDA